MDNPMELYYAKRAEKLVNNLRRSGFDAWFCENEAQALERALELIPRGASVGWGGARSAQQIGLMDAVHQGNYRVLDRDLAQTPQEREQIMRNCFDADWFVTGANGLSITGEMVNIDGMGNRVGMIVYGPRNILVIAGVNKICDSTQAAVNRARSVAAPMNMQRFLRDAPCTAGGVCADCKSAGCICNQVLVTRRSNPAGRIKVIVVGRELGF